MSANRLAKALLLMTMLGCTGKEGPMGPAGENGVDGVANRLMVTAVANAQGSAVVQLPAAVGITEASLPAMSCYMTDDPSLTAWQVIAEGFSLSSPFCGIAFANGRWTVVTSNLPPGWTAAWVVTY